MNIKLREIIWEVTTKCDKGCDYCGSSDILNSEDEKDSDKLLIAREIADYPPKEVNLSGGEPGLLDTKLLNEIIDILKEAGCIVKVITNGKLFNNHDNSTIKKFDAIGLSINSEKDIKEFTNLYTSNYYELKPITIITNFGTHNIWEFDKIKDFTSRFKCWQVQLTDVKYLLPKDGIKHLYEKLNNCSNVVMADNLQYNHDCTAGIYSCGILYNGEVLPCLSMRSWCEDLSKKNNKYYSSNGNILNNSLKEIWENLFKDRRFGDDNSCCRDCVKYPEINESDKNFQINDQIVTISPYECKKYNPSNVYVYAVPNPNTQICMYAVFTDTTTDIKMRYGVFNPKCKEGDKKDDN